MSVGTDLLVRVFETFTQNNSQEKISRRLLCESGQAGIKSYRYVNDATKVKLKQIIPKCQDCKHYKLKPITVVLVFEELVALHEPELLQEMYTCIGGPSNKAYKLCNKKTQDVIRQLGLQEKIQVKGKSHTQKKPNN